MLRTLKILSVLLKVLMLTRTAIMSSSKDQEDIAQDIPVFELIDVRDYMSSNIESVQDHIDSETVKTEVGLQESITPSPKGTPSEPTFPRAFVEFDNILNKKDIFVTFRWNKPEFPNRTIQKYRIQFVENLNRTIQSVNILPNAILQYKVYDLKPDTMYYFKVQAYNEFGAGPYTKFINVSTTHENSVPRLFINSYSGLHVLDIDLQIKFAINEYDIYKEIAYSALEHKIYGITKTWELITWDFNPSAIETKSNYTKIIKFDGSVHSLCIDWVARNLYWIQVSNQTNNIMKLDLTLWQSFGIVEYNIILSGISETNFLNLLPSTGYFYWMGSTSNKQYIIMQSDFDGKNMKPFLKNEDNKCICPYKLTELPSAMQIDNTNIDKPLMYWTSEDRLFAADIYGCGCNQILSAGNQTNFEYLTIDKRNIYLYCENEELIYILNKKYVLLESKENAFERVQKVRIQGSFRSLHQFTALDKSLQPYPSTICLTPNIKNYRVEEVNTTANSIVVNLPEPIPNSGCEKYSFATTIYNISMSYLTCLDNDLNKSEEFNMQTYKRHYEFQNLTPFTEYKLKLALSNFYIDKLSLDLQFGAGVKLTTTTGKLNAPENVTVQVLTPTIAAVYWMPPKKLNCVAVNYEVYWWEFPNSTQENEFIVHARSVTKPERTLDGKFFMIIPSLLPEEKYNILVAVNPTNSNNLGTDSLTKTIYMKPSNLTLSGVSTDSMNISLISSVNLTIHTGISYTLEYKETHKGCRTNIGCGNGKSRIALRSIMTK